MSSDDIGEAYKKLRREEQSAHRILWWVARLSEREYQDRHYQRDLDTVIAVCEIMAVEGETPHMQRILRTHMEKITAYQLIGERQC